MTVRARFVVCFTGYWLSGTGAARGRDVDAVPHLDNDGLPALPMTQVKGQLRETAERLAAAGEAGWTDQLVVRLFGERSDPNSLRDDPAQGALAFRGEARLPQDVRSWLAAPSHQDRRARLFARIPATEIGNLGAASDHSLRAVKAVVPLTLEGEILWRDAAPAADWVEALDAACAATLAFGKLKADGYGRAIAEAVAA